MSLNTLDHPGAPARRHDRCLLTARERISLLLDPGSFTELDRGDGVLTGRGEVEGRPVHLWAHDLRFAGGALGEASAAGIQRLLDTALAEGTPVVALDDCAGVREDVAAPDGYGGTLRRAAALAGTVPQITVLLGPCPGGTSYGAALADFVFAVRGAAAPATAQFVHDDEPTCLEDVRRLLTLLPPNRNEPPRTEPSEDPPERLVRHWSALDVGDLIAEVVDDGDCVTIGTGPGTRCALARIGGHAVGLVAACDRAAGAGDAARFVGFCDTFGIPLVTVADVPPVRPHPALLAAYCAATTPRISLLLRPAEAGTGLTLDSRPLGADVCLAWRHDGPRPAADEVIQPAQTRRVLVRWLAVLRARAVPR
ncbi:carboxyl transferase domain-containing protein [Amycolatopsis sp. cmx-4-83]|uniref:carboxyl transferase domain-containing protein n=1 Tax=Amycolatopsis sp. cmx-4-83 TaxID=2790940 RepID=UPI00397B74FB